MYIRKRMREVHKKQEERCTLERGREMYKRKRKKDVHYKEEERGT